MEDFNERIEYLYLKMQLSLDIPALSSRPRSDLIFESGVFAGFESATPSSGRGGMGGGGWGGGYVSDAFGRLETLLGSFNSM